MLPRLRDFLRQVWNQMARRPAVFCGAVVLLSCLLILAVKLTCSRAKHVVAAARPPVRFFSAEAPVVDLFLGQLEQAERLRGVAEVSLIFFYAPWCAHSASAREEVQQVALRLAKQVQFVAVNCWWSLGKCRRQKNFYQYPVIHLYYRRFGPIEYNGPFMAAYVERFILRVITPLTYLPSRAILQDFLSYHEPGVVGFFEFNSSPQPPGYVTYLSSALQALKRDFQGSVRFGIVTNKAVAAAISVREDETVYLHRRFNSSLIFPRLERDFTSEGICSWVYEHRESVLPWLQPHGGKSRRLEEELRKGPALLLFLPHNPLGANHQLLTEIADIAVRYHSCSGPSRPDPQAGRGSSATLLPSPELSPVGPCCCHSLLLPAGWSAVARRDVCELCVNRSRAGSSAGPEEGPPLASPPPRCSLLELGTALDSFLRRLSVSGRPALPRAPPVGACSNVQDSYSPFGRYSACCRTLQPGAGTPPTEGSGEWATPPGPQEERDTPVLSPPPPADDCPLPLEDGLTGLRCRTNKTLRFYLLDSHLHWGFAQRLGALGNGSGALGNGSGRAFATIVNLPDETHYVLEHRDRDSLEHFIRNFSAPYSPLQRHLVGDTGLNPPEALIREVTTGSFLTTVMDPERDVLLYYYTKWCGFCTVLNHIIIQLARLFQGNSKFIVARVNVARNDLPWEFMVDHFPTILLFPRHRKQHSVKFPEDAPVTLPNLVRFVLRHADSALRGSGSGSRSPLEAELRSLRAEVEELRRVRARLSEQLAALQGDGRPPPEAQGAALRLDEQSRRLAGAARRLRELGHAAEGNTLADNTLLRALLAAVGEGEEEEEEGGGGRSGERKEAS